MHWNLMPHPRRIKRLPGFFTLRNGAVVHLEASLPRDTVLLPVARRLAEAAEDAGFEFEIVTGPPAHPRQAIRAIQSTLPSANPEAYTLLIEKQGIIMHYRQVPGLRAAVATLRQLLREFGRRLPCLKIEDYPDFARRGVMLDISRGRVPTLATLMGLVDHLADFKINEFQLYIEHTFAYRNYERIWKDWGALTGEEILQLDARCRELGIDLVPNQNSFGHLRYWLEDPAFKALAEVDEPYESQDGTYLRYPTTLAPKNRATLPFIKELYDEFLPHFTSPNFNVGCDETWDLGRGQSRWICERHGTGRVYLDFLKQIHREVTRRGRRMQFWGDIVVNHPGLIRDVPRDAVALNWGYEADHPFEKQAAKFADSGLKFYVCPGTSSWMSLVGRNDNGFANLRRAADAGARSGATGFLNTDWGDGGHPQPLAVSYASYLLGAALSWCRATADEGALEPVLSRDVFQDPTRLAARAALGLGVAHRKLKFTAMNVTPLGAVIAAPPPALRELVCRDGLKYYSRISQGNIRAALEEVEAQRGVLYRSKSTGRAGEVLALELDLAARMAAESCHFMPWQQELAGGRKAMACRLAKRGVRRLRELDDDFDTYWPLRNKATASKCSAFLKWRVSNLKLMSLTGGASSRSV